MRYLELTPAVASTTERTIWNLYAAEQRAARGLRAQDSLDRRDGVVLPNAQAVTQRAVSVYTSDDGLIAAVSLQDEALVARAGVSLLLAKEQPSLDARLRSKVPDGQPGPAPTSGASDAVAASGSSGRSGAAAAGS